MLSTLSRLLGRLFTSVLTLVVVVLLAATTLAAWHFYQEERLRAQLMAEGEPVTVQVERIDRDSRQVWDALGNFVYVGFRYRGRPYEVRGAPPARWLATGDRLELRHLPGPNVFGLPRAAPPTGPRPGVSRLVKWSVGPDVAPQTQALLAFGLAAGALFFGVGALLGALTGWRFSSALGRPLGALVLGAAALYSTYDATQYYLYVAALQRDGRPLTVAVLRAERHAEHRRSHNNFHTYTYTADFDAGGQRRTVALNEANYDRLRTSAPRRLDVRYDAGRDDFIAADYSPDWGHVVAPVFFWVVLGLLIRRAAGRRLVA